MDDVMGLIDRAHHGDERARAQLVEQNMGLVWSIVRRFSGRGTENEDLFQIGAIGLMKAIDKFDCSFEVRFSTYPDLEIQNLGETDFIIEYESPEYSHDRLAWLKVSILCVLIFFGSAFSIMVFNNDVGVHEVFARTYELVTGQESNGFTVMEIMYSVGIAVGIIVFYNHFGGKRITKDPTPIEVQMRLYEDDVNTTLVEGCNRKETSIDVD